MHCGIAGRRAAVVPAEKRGRAGRCGKPATAAVGGHREGTGKIQPRRGIAEAITEANDLALHVA